MTSQGSWSTRSVCLSVCPSILCSGDRMKAGWGPRGPWQLGDKATQAGHCGPGSWFSHLISEEGWKQSVATGTHTFTSSHLYRHIHSHEHADTPTGFVSGHYRLNVIRERKSLHPFFLFFLFFSPFLCSFFSVEHLICHLHSGKPFLSFLLICWILKSEFIMVVVISSDFFLKLLTAFKK